MAPQVGQRRIENVAADVVKINVDPFGTLLAQRLAHVFGLVVNRRIEADLGDEIAALLGASGDANDAAAMDPGYLPRHHTDRAGGTRNDHDLAGLRFADVEETEIGGHAWQAERAEEDWQRRPAWIDLRDTVAFRDGIFLNPRSGHTHGRRRRSPGASNR